MLDGARQLLAEGYYDLNGNFSNGVKNNYNFKIIFKDYYLKLFEYLIDDIIDNTQGSLSGNFDIQKIDGKPNFNGKLNIKEGSLKINYLGTTYLIELSPLLLNNTMIDATGVTLKNQSAIPARFREASYMADLKTLALMQGSVQTDF